MSTLDDPIATAARWRPWMWAALLAALLVTAWWCA